MSDDTPDFSYRPLLQRAFRCKGKVIKVENIWNMQDCSMIDDVVILVPPDPVAVYVNALCKKDHLPPTMVAVVLHETLPKAEIHLGRGQDEKGRSYNLIILSERILTGYKAGEIAAVINHELGHIKENHIEQMKEIEKGGPPSGRFSKNV